MLDDIGIDLPKAPNNFGEILGSLVMASASGFELVKDILMKMEDEWFKKAVLDAVIKSFKMRKTLILLFNGSVLTFVE
ncbi:unnamed protein product [Brassica rapa subsp. trilocularis]